MAKAIPLEIPVTYKGSVRITDIDIPFWSMVKFMVKWAIASVPAVIILWILAAFTVTLFKMLFFP